MKFILLLFSTLVAANAELEFTGFFTTSKVSFYMLTDLETRVGSGWLQIGQTFGGYTVEAFDREHDVLILQKAGQIVRVALRESKIKDDRSTITGTIELGMNETLNDVRATLYFDQEMSFPLKPGVDLLLTAERLPDGNLSYRARFQITQSGGTRGWVDFPPITALAGQPFRIKSGDYGFGFIPEKRPHQAPKQTTGSVTPRAIERP
jgi:hypothetical protein